jgi:hypothetical protein
MRYLTLNIADNLQLSIDNSMTGVETIYMNEEIVSKKFSFWGAKHIFSREENGEEVNYEVKIGLNFTGIGYNIYRNGEPVLLSNNVSKLNNFSWFDVAAYLILFIASATLGYTLTRGLLNDDYSLTKAIPSLIMFSIFSFYFYWRKRKNQKAELVK